MKLNLKKSFFIMFCVCFLVLASYFFLTPRGSISLKLLTYNPIYAFTFQAEVYDEEHGIDSGCSIYVLKDPIYIEVTDNYLDRWTVYTFGPLHWAVYGYA